MHYLLRKRAVANLEQRNLLILLIEYSFVFVSLSMHGMVLNKCS